MSAVIWKPTKAAVDAAILAASGTEVQIGNTISAALFAIGTVYDTLFTPDVDAAKTASASATSAAQTAWTTQATNAHNSADAACRYVENVVGAPAATLIFDATTFPQPILIRLLSNNGTGASPPIGDISLAESNNLIQETNLLTSHRELVEASSQSRPIVGYFVPVTPYDGRVSPDIIGGGAFAKQRLDQIIASISSQPLVYVVNNDTLSVRAIEARLSAYITLGSHWVAMAAYP